MLVPIVLGLFLATSQATSPASPAVPDGGVIRLRLEQDLSTKKSRPGDRIKLTLADIQDMRLPDGTLVIPAGAEFIATVTRSERGNGKVAKAAISIVVTEARWNSGSVPLNGFIVGQIRVRTERMVSSRSRRTTSSGSGRWAPPPPTIEQQARGQTTGGTTVAVPTETYRGETVYVDAEKEQISLAPSDSHVSVLLSPEKDVVLPKGSTFLIRHAPAKLTRVGN